MEDEVVSAVYSDSKEPITVGDRLLVDDLPARVTGCCSSYDLRKYFSIEFHLEVAA
jgi:hypothetical protein